MDDYHARLFVYVGRKPCRCVSALVTDDPDPKMRSFVARSVHDFIKQGLSIERIPWQAYADNVRSEPTFFACPHTGPQQLDLFSAPSETVSHNANPSRPEIPDNSQDAKTNI